MTTPDDELGDNQDEGSCDDHHDVVIVGGGPAGCSAGVFCAREGLDTVMFDRGRSSIQRCAHLENFLGFPKGIDIDTFSELTHDHAESAGCTIVPDLVESIDRPADGNEFVIETQEDNSCTAQRVIAATRYDGEYMRGLDDNESMFTSYEYDGETYEQFDRGYPDRDGTTPIDGLYVASPSDEADTQAIMAAGRGARVSHRVIADARIDDGWWESVADGVDWVRRDAELTDQWTDREAWVANFDERHKETADCDPDSARFKRVRDAAIDSSLSMYISDEEIDARRAAGQAAIASHFNPKWIVDGVGAETLLEAIDDETIEAYRRKTATNEVDQ